MSIVFWILFSVAYVAVAVLCFVVIRKAKKHISESKHYSRHPEQMTTEFGGLLTDIVVSALWPLQIVGLLFYGMKG